MRLLVSILVMSAATLRVCLGAGLEDEIPDVYELAIACAVPVLPDPLQDFFGEHVQTLEQHATSKLGEKVEADAPTITPDWHFIMLDAGVETADADARRAAVRQFPRDRAEARKRFRSTGTPRGGELPWVIAERHTALVEAFTARDGAALLREAGTLVHFCADAAMPLNTTRNRDGAETGHLRWAGATATQQTRPYRTVRHRLQGAVVRRLRDRLAYEARVWPALGAPVEDVVDAVFETLIDANDDLDTLLAIDRDVMTTLGIADEDTFARKVEAYEQQAAERASRMLESRIEAAALLGANLIASAWMDAGKPAPGVFEAAKPDAETPAASENTRPGPYVGSRNSKVYHRATCSHAKRIKEENLVWFKSVEEATRVGRTPCRSCSPDRP
jgi:hypothetical protein